MKHPNALSRFLMERKPCSRPIGAPYSPARTEWENDCEEWEAVMAVYLEMKGKINEA